MVPNRAKHHIYIDTEISTWKATYLLRYGNKHLKGHLFAIQAEQLPKHSLWYINNSLSVNLFLNSEPRLGKYPIIKKFNNKVMNLEVKVAIIFWPPKKAGRILHEIVNPPLAGHNLEIRISVRKLIKGNNSAQPLRGKCPNTELFLVRIFLHFSHSERSVRIHITRSISNWKRNFSKKKIGAASSNSDNWALKEHEKKLYIMWYRW